MSEFLQKVATDDATFDKVVGTIGAMLVGLIVLGIVIVSLA